MMRRVIVALLAVVPCVAQVAQPVPKGVAQIARWVVDDVWNRGDYSLGDRLLAPVVILHYRGQAIRLTPDQATGVVQTWRAAFPDFHFELEDMMVDGNKAALRIPFTGTHKGRFWGLEPTGTKISVTETLVIRVEEDRIVEMWEDYDEYGLRIQLGLLKPN